jgi:hypothetical protein
MCKTQHGSSKCEFLSTNDLQFLWWALPRATVMVMEDRIFVGDKIHKLESNGDTMNSSILCSDAGLGNEVTQPSISAGGIIIYHTPPAVNNWEFVSTCV